MSSAPTNTPAPVGISPTHIKSENGPEPRVEQFTLKKTDADRPEQDGVEGSTSGDDDTAMGGVPDLTVKGKNPQTDEQPESGKDPQTDEQPESGKGSDTPEAEGQDGSSRKDPAEDGTNSGQNNTFQGRFREYPDVSGNEVGENKTFTDFGTLNLPEDPAFRFTTVAWLTTHGQQTAYINQYGDPGSFTYLIQGSKSPDYTQDMEKSISLPKNQIGVSEQAKKPRIVAIHAIAWVQPYGLDFHKNLDVAHPNWARSGLPLYAWVEWRVGDQTRYNWEPRHAVRARYGVGLEDAFAGKLERYQKSVEAATWATVRYKTGEKPSRNQYLKEVQDEHSQEKNTRHEMVDKAIYAVAVKQHQDFYQKHHPDHYRPDYRSPTDRPLIKNVPDLVNAEPKAEAVAIEAKTSAQSHTQEAATAPPQPQYISATPVPQPGQQQYNQATPSPQPGQQQYNQATPSPQPGQQQYNQATPSPQPGQQQYNQATPSPQPGQQQYNQATPSPQPGQQQYNQATPSPQPGQQQYNQATPSPQPGQQQYNQATPSPQPGQQQYNQATPSPQPGQQQYNQATPSPQLPQQKHIWETPQGSYRPTPPPQYSSPPPRSGMRIEDLNLGQLQTMAQDSKNPQLRHLVENIMMQMRLFSI